MHWSTASANSTLNRFLILCRYGANDFDGYGGYSDDNYFYFGDEYDNYYDMYGFDANGYGYDYFNLELPKSDCQDDETGDVKLQGVLVSQAPAVQLLAVATSHSMHKKMWICHMWDCYMHAVACVRCLQNCVWTSVQLTVSYLQTRHVTLKSPALTQFEEGRYLEELMAFIRYLDALLDSHYTRERVKLRMVGHELEGHWPCRPLYGYRHVFNVSQTSPFWCRHSCAVLLARLPRLGFDGCGGCSRIGTSLHKTHNVSI